VSLARAGEGMASAGNPGRGTHMAFAPLLAHAAADALGTNVVVAVVATVVNGALVCVTLWASARTAIARRGVAAGG
jgi:hypothetical protein